MQRAGGTRFLCVSYGSGRDIPPPPLCAQVQGGVPVAGALAAASLRKGEQPKEAKDAKVEAVCINSFAFDPDDDSVSETDEA